VGARRTQSVRRGVLSVIAFVAGTGYLIMTDTPPLAPLLTHWIAGLAAAGVVGYGLGRRMPSAVPAGRRPLTGRAAQAVCEAAC
jgi:hypothetical protein